jgi:hypothetical protein
MHQPRTNTCDVFISYCWSNSQKAVDKGRQPVSGALGECDPRDVDKWLGEQGSSQFSDHCLRFASKASAPGWMFAMRAREHYSKRFRPVCVSVKSY